MTGDWSAAPCTDDPDAQRGGQAVVFRGPGPRNRPPQYGVWGGFTAEQIQRRAARARRKAAA